jgi:RimJ/RimL family protein N-acetyltransferase
MTDAAAASNAMSAGRRDREDQWSLRPYPSELATDVVTDRGVILHLRPIRFEDADLLVRFHRALSPDSIYRRYFSIHPELSDAEVRHLTQVDYVDRFAFIVESGDALVGVGRFDRIPDTTTAEVAFIVADEYQHQGLGLLLLDHLADEAWSLGVTTFTAETQSDNRSMLGVFRASGFPVASRLEGDTISACFSIQPTDESRASRANRQDRLRDVGRRRGDRS